MCGFSDCGCSSITVQRGAAGAGTTMVRNNSGNVALTTDIYAAGSGATVGTTTIAAGTVTNPTNTADITFSAAVQGTDAFLVTATLYLNGVARTEPYNISKTTLPAGIAAATYAEVLISGQLSNVRDGDQIAVKLLSSSGAVTSIVTSWTLKTQIFQ